MKLRIIAISAIAGLAVSTLSAQDNAKFDLRHTTWGITAKQVVEAKGKPEDVSEYQVTNRFALHSRRVVARAYGCGPGLSHVPQLRPSRFEFLTDRVPLLEIKVSRLEKVD